MGEKISKKGKDGLTPLTIEVLRILVEGSLSKAEIAVHLGKKKPGRYLNDLMVAMVKQGKVEYTIPEKPNSRFQKYRITQLGKQQIMNS